MPNSKPFVQGGYTPDPDSPNGFRNGGINDEGAGAISANVSNTISAAAGAYDLSLAANQLLNVFFSEDNGASYRKIALTGIVGATPAASTAAEVAALLMANAVFASRFTAVDNAGTLDITCKMPSSRFKVYFTGGCATQLGNEIAAAAAPGSAEAGGTNAGQAFEFTMLDQLGNPMAKADVFLSALVSGTAKSTCGIGLISKGDLVGNQGQYDAARMQTDVDGKVAGYLCDTAAETVVLTARPLSNTSKMAIALQGTKSIVVS